MAPSEIPQQYGSAMIGNNTSALLSAGESRHRRAYKFKQVSRAFTGPVAAGVRRRGAIFAMSRLEQGFCSWRPFGLL